MSVYMPSGDCSPGFMSPEGIYTDNIYRILKQACKTRKDNIRGDIADNHWESPLALLSASEYICIPEKTGNMDKIRNQYLPLKDEGYNCFACAPWNPCGLKMEFYEDGDEVVSIWTPSDNYQGWFKTLHGGIQATLIDEVSGWFVNRKLQLAGMTTNLNIRYRKSIPTGADEKIEIRVRLKEMRRDLAVLEGRILHGTQLCTTAEITFFTFDEKTSREQFHFDGCRLEKECEEGCGQ